MTSARAKHIIAAWVQQLSEAESLLDEPGHVEITLYANKGKVRKRPLITYNGGPVEMVEPAQVTGGSEAAVT